MQQLMVQTIGSGAVVLTTFAAAMVLMYAVKATGTLRVSPEGELEGLDLHEHGMLAYPEYVIHSYGQPHFVPSHDAASRAVAEVRPEPAR
jgi:Amt family ammonium transporter